jgi:hypothetical protein
VTLIDFDAALEIKAFPQEALEDESGVQSDGSDSSLTNPPDSCDTSSDNDVKVPVGYPADDQVEEFAALVSFILFCLFNVTDISLA